MDICISISFCYNNDLFSFDGLLLLERFDESFNTVNYIYYGIIKKVICIPRIELTNLFEMLI